MQFSASKHPSAPSLLSIFSVCLHSMLLPLPFCEPSRVVPVLFPPFSYAILYLPGRQSGGNVILRKRKACADTSL